METAETFALCLNHLQTELSRADSQLASLENISIAPDKVGGEHALRNISANLRDSMNRMRGDLLRLETFEQEGQCRVLTGIYREQL